MHLPRYRLGARWYDVLSLERPLYRSGRLAALDLVDPHPGDRVLDVGCGTGLNFPELVDAVGDSGRIVALDASKAMLRRARHRIERHGWTQIELVRADARALDGTFDVIVFCYSLAIVPAWTEVWRRALDCLAPGGRVAVVDTAYLTGWRRLFNPLAWVLLTAGGVHPRRRVWDAVVRDTCGAVRGSRTGGHVQLAVGTKR